MSPWDQETGEVKEQELFMGDIPLMTDRGTFIINGAERVVVSQLVRSPGAYFTIERDTTTGRPLCAAKLIPSRGAWLEFETSAKGVISVKVDRRRKMPVTTLILPVVFDDLRETGIRPTLIEAFNNQKVSFHLKKTKIGRKLVSKNGNQDAAGNDLAALEDTVQEKSEKYLNDEMNEIWSIWERRAELRGRFFTNLYFFRNWLFGINPSSIRKIIPGRYRMNLDALRAVFQSANDKGIKVLLYIPPLRNDVKVPYELDQYGKFKTEIQLLTQENGAKFLNLERLVPAELWGTKDSTTLGMGQELDFMHFQAGGHKRLANALYGELKVLWSEETNNDF